MALELSICRTSKSRWPYQHLTSLTTPFAKPMGVAMTTFTIFMWLVTLVKSKFSLCASLAIRKLCIVLESTKAQASTPFNSQATNISRRGLIWGSLAYMVLSDCKVLRFATSSMSGGGCSQVRTMLSWAWAMCWSAWSSILHFSGSCHTQGNWSTWVLLIAVPLVFAPTLRHLP